MRVEDIETPAVVIDHARVRRNIARMAEMARGYGAALRPHTKTHKLPSLARWQLDAGASGITVAKVSEAEVMAASGLADIFIANELVAPAKIRRLAALARWITVSVGVDSREGADALASGALAEGMTLHVMIETNTGLNRCGVPPGEAVLDLARYIASQDGLAFDGIFTHAGHAYAASSPAQRNAVGADEGQAMAETARLLAAHGLAPTRVSVGSTPTARSSAAVAGVTEVRPDNYVFHDCMQVGLGVATWDDCALRVRATVISRPHPCRAVIDAGSKTLGSDVSPRVRGHGRLCEHPHGLLARLSEEHGVITFEEPTDLPRIGDVVTVIPVHACPVTNLANEVYLVDGERVEAVWPVLGRGKVE